MRRSGDCFNLGAELLTLLLLLPTVQKHSRFSRIVHSESQIANGGYTSEAESFAGYRWRICWNAGDDNNDALGCAHDGREDGYCGQPCRHVGGTVGGWVGMPFMNGSLIFPLIYVLVLFRYLKGGPVVRGITWGVLLWLMAQLLVMPMIGAGMFSSRMGGMMAVVSLR
jgi:hypothetical protein